MKGVRDVYYWVEYYQYGLDDRLTHQTPCKTLHMARSWINGIYRPDSRAVTIVYEVGDKGQRKEIARRNWNQKRTVWHKPAPANA